MDPVAPKSVRNNTSALWAVIVLIVALAAGIGGYFLGRESKNDSPAGVQTNTEQEATTGVAEYCAQDWCINYDRAKWHVDEENKADEQGLGGGIHLAYKVPEHHTEARIQFETEVDGLGGACSPPNHKCYFKTVSIKPHPNTKGLHIVKVIDLMRDSGGAIYQATPSMYVVDDVEVKERKLQVGKEVEGHVIGLRFDTDKKYPDTSNPVRGSLRLSPSQSFETLKAAEAYLNPVDESDVRDDILGPEVSEAYKVLESLQKKQ
jgi:hypothetical protein